MVVGFGFATYANAGGVPQGTGQGGTQTPPTTKTEPAAPTQSSVPSAPIKPDPIAKKPLTVVSAVTFPDSKGTAYILGRDLATQLQSSIELSPDEKTVKIEDKEINTFRRTYNGDVLIPVKTIAIFNGTLAEDPATKVVTVSVPTGEFQIEVGKKRIEVDKATQELVAYQGNVVVVKTNISTGRPGHNTPNGNFLTGPKERIHYSRKYDNAPMPYAIQVNGDVFLHGYTSVPSYPASHGCVRIPLTNQNPARYLFSWVERGTETKIFGVFSWEDHSKRRRKKSKNKAQSAKVTPSKTQDGKPNADAKPGT